MQDSHLQPGSASATGREFHTTRWSMVLVAKEAESTQQFVALEELCRNYWFPLYAFVRRKGWGADDSQDLTQEFFARLLEKNYLESVDARKGKFRSFLLAAMEHFLANEWNRRNAQKRGGGTTVLSIDDDTAEARYKIEPTDSMTPERLYDRRWAQTVMDIVLVRLRGEFERTGKAERFDELKVFLVAGRGASSYSEVGERLGMSEQAITSAVHRLRQRYQAVFREEIANTLEDPTRVEEEIAHLFEALANP